MTDINLFGRVFINANIKAVTGLHIGGANAGLEIGGVDKAVLRNPLNDEPYIPGSSLRGKMRSQLEKVRGLKQNKKIGQATIHACESVEEYKNCPVCTIFGIAADEKKNEKEDDKEKDREKAKPARLIIRDTQLHQGSRANLKKAKVETFSEFKTEVAIDRVTSAAVPRTMERVPAGAEFGPAELIFNIYEAADFDRLKTVVEAMLLVENDYLGGGGSRGSGKVEFSSIGITARKSSDYLAVMEYEIKFNSVQQLAKGFTPLKTWLTTNVPTKPAE